MSRSRTAGRPALAAALALALAGASNCTAAVNGFDDVCRSDADCAARGGPFATAVCRRGLCQRSDRPDPWACAGQIDYVRPQTPTIALAVKVVDPLSRAPVPDQTVVACSSLDTACASPLTAPVTTDANGAAALTVSTEAAVTGVFGFSGYLRVTGPGRNPFLSFIAPPLVADRQVTLSIGTTDTLKLLSPSASNPVDTSRAQAIVSINDCSGARASGVRVEVEGGDDASRVYYIVGVSPNESATATDAPGIAYAVNLPPGLVIVHAVDAATGREVARLNVVTQAGFVSRVDLSPTPL
jgi:hypothetical protein